MTLQIDVVIPTRNREHLLPRVVAPLLEDPAVHRIIVVDDADVWTPQGDETIASRSERIHVIHTGGAGPAKARQAGAESATAEVLLFLDDDVLPDRTLASRHALHHETSSRLVVCGYTPVIPRPEGRISAEAAVYGQTYEERCVQYELDERMVLTHLWGGNFSLRREHALQVGLASDSFTQTWHEDRDFGLRCLRAGLTAVFDRTIQAGHEYEREWAVVTEESYRRGYSLVLLHRLHESIIGPLDERQFERGLPRPLGSIVHLSARPRGGRITIKATYVLRWLGGRLRLWQLQVIAVRLLRRIQGARGARDALESLAPETPAVDG
jgi:glycosyltransferase involved in cell wall biosynthesis